VGESDHVLRMLCVCTCVSKKQGYVSVTVRERVTRCSKCSVSIVCVEQAGCVCDCVGESDEVLKILFYLYVCVEESWICGCGRE